MTRAVTNREIRVESATLDRWNDVVTAFGRRGNDPDWCWCQRFVDGPEAESNKLSLRLEISSAEIPSGLLAYVDNKPVGWTRVMPRRSVAAVQGNRALQRVLTDDTESWWVVCFAVDQRHRNAGVATALLEAAVAHARNNRASAVEGHPVDAAALSAETVSGSALFTGTMATFVAAGFTEIGRTYPSRPVMRLPLVS